MQVDEATVRRIARLARIKVTDAEAKALETELSGILDWVKQLDEVDTSNVEPMTRVTPMTLKQRADVVTDGGIADDDRRQRAGARGSLLRGAEGGGVSGIRRVADLDADRGGWPIVRPKMKR